MSPFPQDVKEAVVQDGVEVLPEWKKELNERLAATRSRRLRIRGEQVALPGLEPAEDKVESRAARLAAKVARRYANAPSYRDVLAAEAQARIERAEVALADVSSSRAEQEPTVATEDEGKEAFGIVASVVANPVVASHAAAAEALPAQEEEAIEPLPANVLDIPRELVAARKVRPRLAEGPLSQATPSHQPQLKVFEVAPETVSQQVSIPAANDWSAIRLDPHPTSASRADTRPPAQNKSLDTALETPLQTASLEDRMMAGIFDLALIVAAFVLFVLVFVACTSHPPSGRPALLGAVSVLLGFCVLYQYLFFKFAGGTPGMRYAKIALCTFEDENPTRKAMCRRVWFQLLAAAPLGLGFAWAWFDADRLGWHDRMSRIYQRSYA